MKTLLGLLVVPIIFAPIVVAPKVVLPIAVLVDFSGTTINSRNSIEVVVSILYSCC